jgi:dihydropteroate synthase
LRRLRSLARIDRRGQGVILQAAQYRIDLADPIVMGIVNVTPDSFSDGGRYLASAAAIAHGRALVAAGAAMLDIGGESTRPGAEAVAAEQELERLIPVIEGLRDLGVPLSVDTQKPEVMRAAIGAGAAMINDVNALRAAGAIEAVAASGVAVCLMHMQGTPRTMQEAPRYDNVVLEVGAFLGERALACIRAGIAAPRIVVDPGFGFGKNVGHNLALLRELGNLTALRYPILVGLSRKSMVGAVTGRAVQDRLAGSIAAHLIAAQNGATILRVHDVEATVDALKVWRAVRRAGA